MQDQLRNLDLPLTADTSMSRSLDIRNRQRVQVWLPMLLVSIAVVALGRCFLGVLFQS